MPLVRYCGSILWSMRFLRLILLLAATAVTGCGTGESTNRDTDPTFFGVEKYEFGNEQDQADIRKERPDYRPYE